MADRKLSLPTPSRIPPWKDQDKQNDDAQISPDRIYNKVARLKGLADWPVQTFRRLSLRSIADPTYLTPDKVWPSIVRARENWMMQSERKEVAWAVQQYSKAWQIKDAFMLGLSEFSFVSDQQDFNHGADGTRNATNFYVSQLVYFIDTIALLVCLPFTPFEVQCDIIARCPSRQPALVFANSSRDYSSDADRDLPFKTIIGGLIGQIEQIIEYDNEKAMKELMYAEGDQSDFEMTSPDFYNSHPAHQPPSPGRPGCTCPSCLTNVEALHGDEGRGRMAEEMRVLYEQRLIHLRKMRHTHIEIEVGGIYCLLFRRPELPVDNEVCKYCQDQEYLVLPRKGAKWLAEGNGKKQKSVIYEEPDHLEAPYVEGSPLDMPARSRQR